VNLQHLQLKTETALINHSKCNSTIIICNFVDSNLSQLPFPLGPRPTQSKHLKFLIVLSVENYQKKFNLIFCFFRENDVPALLNDQCVRSSKKIGREWGRNETDRLWVRTVNVGLSLRFRFKFRYRYTQSSGYVLHLIWQCTDFKTAVFLDF